MTEVTEMILSVLRQAWLALAGGLAVIAVLGLLSQVLKATAGATLSTRFLVWQAISSGVAVLMMALFGLVGAPLLSQSAQQALPASSGCGPVADLGALAAALIAALASLRLLGTTFVAVLWASAGASVPLSGALVQAAEAVMGVLLVAVAAPLATHFLGAC